MMIFTQIDCRFTRKADADAPASMTADLPETDAYMDAVHAGDTDTVRRLADEAARTNGYTVSPLYRGDRPGKTSFTGGRGAAGLRLAGNIFLFEDPKLAKFYTSKRTDYMADWKKMGPQDGLYALRANLGGRIFTMDAEGEDWSRLKAPRQIGGKAEYPWGIQIDDLASIMGAKGYTAVVVGNVGDQAGWGTQIIVFDPARVKSADPITYDNQKNPIPLDRRFDSSNPDIRY